MVLEQRLQRSKAKDFIEDFARQPLALGKAERNNFVVDRVADEDQNLFAGRIAGGAAQLFQIKTIEDLAMQIGLYLLILAVLEGLQIGHEVLRRLKWYTVLNYTVLNKDQWARFTSASLRVNSFANPEKQRAISV